MQAIYKYELNRPEVSSRTRIGVPRGGEVLKAGLDPKGKICVWIMIDAQSHEEERTFEIVGTGQTLEPAAWRRWIDSFVQDCYVWHVFEVAE